jgi:hypothetical protein
MISLPFNLSDIQPVGWFALGVIGVCCLVVCALLWLGRGGS